MKAFHPGVAVIALVIVVGIGCPSGDPCLTPGDHIIDLDHNGSQRCPVAVIQRCTPHRVMWRAPYGTTLRIVFRSSSVPPAVCPAPNRTANVCVFGPVGPTVPPSPADGYTYDVFVTGGSPVASLASTVSRTPPAPHGRIIIKK